MIWARVKEFVTMCHRIHSIEREGNFYKVQFGNCKEGLVRESYLPKMKQGG